MKNEPQKPQLRLADVLKRIELEDDYEEFLAADPAAIDREMAEAGVDVDRLKARVDALLAAPGLALNGPPAVLQLAPTPVALPAPAPAPTAKVLDLQAVRARRTTRWAQLAVAAGVLLVVGGFTWRYITTEPTPIAKNVPPPTEVKEPSPDAFTVDLKKRAVSLCQRRYYGECQDLLDQAKSKWPAIEDDPEVKWARKAIRAAAEGKPVPTFDQVRSKPGLGPGERPLQRTP